MMMENWHQHFVPECFFDTVLFKKILRTNKRLLHTRGCNNVLNRFRTINGKKGNLSEKFGVGMIDKDKLEFDFLRYEFEELKIDEKLNLFYNEARKHFVIQLNPPIEKWVISILNDLGKNVNEFGFPLDFKEMKKVIKDDIDKEDDVRLGKLLSFLLTSEHPTINKLKLILEHLRDNTYDADIKYLKNV